ncbi:hypothetical protein Tco_0625462 [Tanacetum coccineum]|uniref:Uncharacterized protein n=1 Tax=Tanacetum coccineum TaxID=301880 RepID=A0ABQ4WGW0_9ASTR
MLPRNLKNMEWNLSDPVDTPLVGSYYENWTRSKGIPVDHNSIQECLMQMRDQLRDVKNKKAYVEKCSFAWNRLGSVHKNTMAERNVPTQPPTRTYEQIVPRSQWLTIGKSNLLFNAQKIQKTPHLSDIWWTPESYQLLTKPFTAQVNVPAIYLQQFWNTMKYNEKTWVYSCQVDEQWFELSVDLLRKALVITPVIPAHPFELPPSGNIVIDFVNELGYPEPVEIVSNIRVNYVYQPWRAILTLINQCLTGKTSGKLIWEEFTQGIQTFFLHKASHNASLTNPKKKVTPLLIPYRRFSKVIIYYLASNNNIHRRPGSAVHHTGDDLYRVISVYKENHLKKVQAYQPCNKVATPNKPTTPTPVKHPTTPPPTKKPSKRKLPQKVRKGKPSFQLVDEDDEAQQESIPREEGNDPDLERAKKMSLEALQEKGEGEGHLLEEYDQGTISETTSKLHEVVGKGKAVVTEEQVAHSLIDLSKKKRTTDQFILVRRDQTSHDSTTGPSSQPEDDTSERTRLRTSRCKAIPVSDPENAHEALAGPDPEPMKEDQTRSDSGKLHVSLVGPNPKHMDDEFLATAYPKVHENLKLITDEHSQVPTAVDKYLGTKLDDALLKVLERHTADLIEKYSVLPGPESIQNQESEKSPKEIIIIKKEQGEEKQDSTYSIRSTDKAGSNQGRSTKRRRSDSAASGSAQPPPKDDDQSSKKPRESDASATKQHPALTSTGWQITDTRDAGADSSMHRSDPESEHSEQSSDDIPMQDEGHVSDLEDTDNAHIPKVSTTTWFKPIPEGERPATPEPEWTIPPNDFPEPENNWANTYATTYQVPAENKLQRKTYDIGSFIKWFCRRTGKKKLCKADLEGPAFNLVKAFHKNSVFLQYQMDECHKLLTNKVDLGNPEGHQILRNIYEPLPLGGPPGQVTIQPQFFFNKDLDYLLTGDKERKIALSISKLKAARYLDFGLEELVPSLWVESERDYDISAAYGITHWWFRRKEFYINKHSEPSDREAVRSQMRILSVISVKVFEKYGYNYLREIILRRADYQEYKISEKDFKNLHPNDFEDLFLLNIQEKLNHLPKTDKTSLHTAVNMWIRNLVIRNRVGDLQLGIESYQTKINLERPNWDAANYYFKEDYTIVPKPRAVVYRDRNDQRKLMRLNELHKFSDGTLTRVMEKLDHMVKDFHLFEYNKGMETRKWSEDDKRRSKDFITAIEKRLQIRRIFRSLESFVGGRIRDIDYRLINRTT